MTEETKKFVVVRKYGCHAPLENERAVVDIMYARNKLWNSMVEAFRATMAIAEELRKGADAEYAALSVMYADVDQRIEALLAAKKSASDKRAVTERIAAERAAKKELVIKLKEARARAKTAAKETTDFAWSEFNDRVKAITRESGIWWGNTETVMESFEAARKKIKSGSQINFHRFTGEGIVRVRQSGGGISVRDFLDGRWSMARLEPLAGVVGDNKARHVLIMRIGMSRADAGVQSIDIRVPIIMHRELDVEAQLKYITLKRVRNGMKFKWSAVFTATKEVIPSFSAVMRPSACGINFGWKKTDDGLRVATTKQSNGPARHYHLQNEWLRVQDAYEADYAALSAHANLHWLSICAALPKAEEGEPGIYRAIRNAKRPSFQRIWALNEILRRDEVKSPLRDLVSACTNTVIDHHHARHGTARHVYRRSEESRARQQQRRDYLYRGIAAEIAATYGYVMLDGSDYADMARLYDAEANKNELHDQARANRVRANVSELRLYIKQAVEKAGGVVELVKPQYISQTCSGCGDIAERASDDIHFICKKCGGYHDIDVNAAENLLSIGMKTFSNHAVA